MGHIFISYSHKDSSYVHKLTEALEKEGFEVWIDDRIHYGSEWPKVVTRNLDASDGVVVVLSGNSYESDMVQNEVARAREKKKPIFPLLLDGENWLIVQAKQFVDVRNGSLPTEKFYRRLQEVATRKKERLEREFAEKAKQVINGLQARFDDVSTIAASVPREQLPEKITELQRLLQTAGEQETPPVLETLKDHQLKHMNFVIDALTAFADRKDQQVVDDLIDHARQEHDEYVLELARLLKIISAP